MEEPIITDFPSYFAYKQSEGRTLRDIYRKPPMTKYQPAQYQLTGKGNFTQIGVLGDIETSDGVLYTREELAAKFGDHILIREGNGAIQLFDRDAAREWIISLIDNPKKTWTKDVVIEHEIDFSAMRAHLDCWGYEHEHGYIRLKVEQFDNGPGEFGLVFRLSNKPNKISRPRNGIRLPYYIAPKALRKILVQRCSVILQHRFGAPMVFFPTKTDEDLNNAVVTMKRENYRFTDIIPHPLYIFWGNDTAMMQTCAWLANPEHMEAGMQLMQAKVDKLQEWWDSCTTPIDTKLALGNPNPDDPRKLYVWSGVAPGTQKALEKVMPKIHNWLQPFLYPNTNIKRMRYRLRQEDNQGLDWTDNLVVENTDIIAKVEVADIPFKFDDVGPRYGGAHDQSL